MMIPGCPFMLISGTKADQKPLNKWASMGGTLGVNIFVFWPSQVSGGGLFKFLTWVLQVWLPMTGSWAKERDQVGWLSLVSLQYGLSPTPSQLCLLYLRLYQESANLLKRAREYLCPYSFSFFLKKQLCKNVQALLSSQLCKNRLQGWTWPVSYSLPTPSLHCYAVQNGSY